jgi:hypothetical protein
MKIAVMQPYLFPYVGYFQLINAVDKFIFFDDVNFIQRGWINRNYFLVNQKKKLITIPCQKASQNKKINEIYPVKDEKITTKILKTLSTSYTKAPYFNTVYPILKSIITFSNKSIARLSANSVLEIIRYLDIKKTIKYSSEEFGETKKMPAADRLIEIAKRENANQYVNSIGGIDLYSKEYFKSKSVELLFLKSDDIKYHQGKDQFIPNLSIIDVLMFNSIEETKAFLNNYQLI